MPKSIMLYVEEIIRLNVVYNYIIRRYWNDTTFGKLLYFDTAAFPVMPNNSAYMGI